LAFQNLFEIVDRRNSNFYQQYNKAKNTAAFSREKSGEETGPKRKRDLGNSRFPQPHPVLELSPHEACYQIPGKMMGRAANIKYGKTGLPVERLEVMRRMGDDCAGRKNIASGNRCHREAFWVMLLLKSLQEGIMTKQEFAKMLADRAGLDSAAQGGKVIDAVLESIKDELASGGTVALKGFGKFSTSDRKARTGRNPQTGQSIQIKACRVARFTPGGELKNAVNSSHFGTDWLKFKDIYSRVDYFKGKIESKIRNSDQLGKEARRYLDKAQTMYEDASEQLKKATDSSGKAWADVKDGLEKAYSELKDAWEKAKKHF
jgi:DNA-binding protein HU-beta